MFLIKALKLITIVALIAAMVWFVFEPGFEPAITSIVILAAILKLYWNEVKEGLTQATPLGVHLDTDVVNSFVTPS